ncbi:MAG: hypothetical protein ACYDH9_19505 [Limisphaerales bacterium]
MKTFLLPIALLTLTSLFGCSHPAAPTQPLAPVAERALADGEDAKLKVGFARFLGLKAEQPLLLKRLQFEKDGATHVLNVLRHDPNTIILSERRQSLTTFYVSDRSGNLSRAVVNDGAIADGGLTNLAPANAAASFAVEKQLWLQRNAH